MVFCCQLEENLGGELLLRGCYAASCAVFDSECLPALKPRSPSRAAPKRSSLVGPA